MTDLFSKNKTEKGFVDWEKTGLLHGIVERDKWHIVLMFDTAYKLLEEDKTSNVQFETVIFPILRRIYTSISVILKNEEKEKKHYDEKIKKLLKLDEFKTVSSKKNLGDKLKTLAKDIFYEYQTYLKLEKFYIEDTEQNRMFYDVEAENVLRFCEEYILKKL